MQKLDSVMISEMAGRFTPGSDKWSGAEMETSVVDLATYKVNKESHDVFNVIDYGAVHDGVNGSGTDDTPAIQAAINAAFANGGGVVYFPLPAPGNEYIISGALQTSINSTNPNSQLYIPLTRFGTSDRSARIELVGEVRTSWYIDQVSGTINDYTNKVVLRSTIIGSGTTPAVFGTPTYTGIFSNRNHTYVTMRNLTIKTRTNTGATHFAGQMTGINFGRLGSFSCDALSIETTSTLSVMPEPTNESYGIIFPEELNFAFCDVGELRVLGYKYGVVPGEHLNAKSIYIGWCKNGLYLKNPQQHGAVIQRLSIEATNTYILHADNNPILINQFAPEFTNSGSFPAWAFSGNIFQVIGSPTVGVQITQIIVGHAFVGGNYEGFPCNDYSKVSCKIFNGRDVSRDAITLSVTDTWGAFRAKKAKISLTGNANITMSEMASGDDVTLLYQQDATGGRTITIAGTVVSINTAANARGVIRGYYDGSAWVWQ